MKKDIQLFSSLLFVALALSFLPLPALGQTQEVRALLMSKGVPGVPLVVVGMGNGFFQANPGGSILSDSLVLQRMPIVPVVTDQALRITQAVTPVSRAAGPVADVKSKLSALYKEASGAALTDPAQKRRLIGSVSQAVTAKLEFGPIFDNTQARSEATIPSAEQETSVADSANNGENRISVGEEVLTPKGLMTVKELRDDGTALVGYSSSGHGDFIVPVSELGKSVPQLGSISVGDNDVLSPRGIVTVKKIYDNGLALVNDGGYKEHYFPVTELGKSVPQLGKISVGDDGVLSFSRGIVTVKKVYDNGVALVNNGFKGYYVPVAELAKPVLQIGEIRVGEDVIMLRNHKSYKATVKKLFDNGTALMGFSVMGTYNERYVPVSNLTKQG